MNIKEKVYTALNSSTDLTNLLVKDEKSQCIYHCRSPSKGSYPILIYTMIEDKPAVIADGAVLERRITIRISILTRDGVFEPIFWAIWKVMVGLGFIFVQSNENLEGDLFVKSIDFRIATNLND